MIFRTGPGWIGVDWWFEAKWLKDIVEELNGFELGTSDVTE